MPFGPCQTPFRQDPSKPRLPCGPALQQARGERFCLSNRGLNPATIQTEFWVCSRASCGQCGVLVAVFWGLPRAAANTSVSFRHLARAGQPRPGGRAVATQASLFRHAGSTRMALCVAVRDIAGYRSIFLGTGRHAGHALRMAGVVGGGGSLSGVCAPCDRR